MRAVIPAWDGSFRTAICPAIAGMPLAVALGTGQGHVFVAQLKQSQRAA
jgi:hypothetical protein